MDRHANRTNAASAAEDAGREKLVIGSVMLWSSPQSARFLQGFAVAIDPGYISSFMENAPLIPADEEFPPDDDKPRFPRAMFEDLAAAGIDAVDQCCFDRTPLDEILGTLEAARRSGSGIRVFPMIDRMPKRGRNFLVELAADKRIIEHPNYLRVGGRPFIVTFSMHGPAEWRERMKLVREAGADFLVVSDSLEYEATPWPYPREVLDELLESVDGLYAFNDLHPSSAAMVRGLADIVRSHASPKLLGAPVTPGYIGIRRQGSYFDPLGTARLRAHWAAILEVDADFAYLTTLNDYTEATEQECSANATMALLDLNAYFIAKWKSGSWPAEHAGRAFLSYRKAVTAGERIDFELVVLLPAGTEAAEQLSPRLDVYWHDGQTTTWLPSPVEVLPGHAVWRFEGVVPATEPGFAVPVVMVSAASGSVRAAPFAVLEPGEGMARKWLHVPLHRVVDLPEATVQIGSDWPRTIRLAGVPWDDVACAVIERDAHSLTPAKQAAALKDGLREPEYLGPGAVGVTYRNGRLFRGGVATRERYSAVVRLHGGKFCWPSPAVVAPPRFDDIATVADPALVFDADIRPGPHLRDLSWRENHIPWPVEEKERPSLVPEDGGFVLRFDGESHHLKAGPWFLPPGPLTVHLRIRPNSLGRAQTILDANEAMATMILLPDGRIRLSRYGRDRQERVVWGRTPLTLKVWADLTASYDGERLRLFVNGREDADPVAVDGLRGDFQTTFGRTAIWANPERNASHFQGDFLFIKVWQRGWSAQEVRNA